MTTACPPSITDTTELVVPKSIPMILLIFPLSSGVRVSGFVFSLRPLSNFSVLLSRRSGGVHTFLSPPLFYPCKRDFCCLVSHQGFECKTNTNLVGAYIITISSLWGWWFTH